MCCMIQNDGNNDIARYIVICHPQAISHVHSGRTIRIAIAPTEHTLADGVDIWRETV